MASQQQGDNLPRIVLMAVALIVLFPLLMMAFVMPMMGWWWAGGGPGTGFSPLWGIGMMLLFLVLLLGVGYFLYRGLSGSQALERDHAIEELRVAYARGDLSDEEFEQRQQRLRRDRD